MDADLFNIHNIKKHQNFLWDNLWKAQVAVWLWLLENYLEKLPDLIHLCVIYTRKNFTKVFFFYSKILDFDLSALNQKTCL